MATEIVPLNIGLESSNLVKTQPYIPGTELYICNIINAASVIMYTVPAGKRLLITDLGVISLAGSGQRNIFIRDENDVLVWHGPAVNIVGTNIARSITEHYDPPLELLSGWDIVADAGGTRTSDYGKAHGYLITTYDGV